jgi:putative nucleotidyltransferase with HDIG domain
MNDTERIAPAALTERVAMLPPLPQAVQELMRLLGDESLRVEQCAARIAHDAALAARTLRLANSSFYGVPGRVASINDAVQLVGLRTLRSLVTAAAVSLRLPAPECAGFDAAAFWRHALACAFAAREIATLAGQDEEAAFTAGLLHDCGRLAFAAWFPAPYAVVLSTVAATGATTDVVERTLLGLDHAAAGAALAAHWHFPAEVVDTIAAHHRPPPGDGAPRLVDIVHAADMAVHALESLSDPHETEPQPVADAWQRLALGEDAMHALLARVEAGVAETCQAIGL